MLGVELQVSITSDQHSTATPTCLMRVKGVTVYTQQIMSNHLLIWETSLMVSIM